MKISFTKKENNLAKKNTQFNPTFYWKISVGGTFLFILLASVFGYYLFIQTNKESNISTNGGAKIPTIEEARMEKALNYFFEKEQKSENILTSPAPVVDPSL